MALDFILEPLWMHVVQQFMHQHLKPVSFSHSRIQLDQSTAHPSQAVCLVTVQFPFGDSDSRCCHSA